MSESMELTTTEAIRLEQCEATIQEGLQTFVEVGQALMAIRDERLYRETYRTFEEYCERRWQMARRYAYNLIDAAEVMVDLCAIAHTTPETPAAILPANEAQARPLAQIQDPEERREVWQEVVRTAPEGKVTAAHVQAIVKTMTEPERQAALQVAKVIREEGAQEKRTKLEVVRTVPVAPPAGKYSTIVIDPPWPIEHIDRTVRPNQVEFDYPTMSEDELFTFEVEPFAADDAHLYLWTTHKHFPLALMLAERWGFKYQCVMTWRKNVGFTPFSWMYSTEHVLFCRRGNLPLLKLGERLDFEGKVREHSRKPEEFYDLVRLCSPEPRIDVFSRQRRNGFDPWGNEAEKFLEVADDLPA